MTIYVELLNEGTYVIRPVPSKEIAPNVHQLFPTDGYDSELEEWQFPPGSIVVCEPKTTDNQTILVATRLK